MRFSSSDQVRRLRRFAIPDLDNVHFFANGHYPSLTITVSAGRSDGYGLAKLHGSDESIHEWQERAVCYLTGPAAIRALHRRFPCIAVLKI
ncbi:hypothetical protein AT574_00690 [Phaeobacter inhibens]|nr:hypothetical protein AT574_00690 [Phaeobacter inhibens]